jgi:hypothetical protein
MVFLRSHLMRQSDEVARLPEAREGFVLLPRRWVVERRCV